MRLKDMSVERIQYLLFTPQDVIAADGRLEGMRRLLLGQIEKRFGAASEATRTRIEAIEEETELQSLGERLFLGDDLEALGLA